VEAGGREFDDRACYVICIVMRAVWRPGDISERVPFASMTVGSCRLLKAHFAALCGQEID
jgi:hypothetical protein